MPGQVRDGFETAHPAPESASCSGVIASCNSFSLKDYMANSNPKLDQGPERIGDIVSIYLRGSVWHVVYQHAGKQHRKSLKTRSRKEARRRALVIECDVLAGQHQPERRPPLIAEVAADFRAAKVGEGLALKTLQKYDHCIRLLNELAEELEIKRIDQISP
jgi:hypothetical protein